MSSSDPRRIKVLHLITGLQTGGAEMVLYRLLQETDRSVFESRVISLTSDGPVGEKIRSLGVSVRALELDRRAPNPFLLLKLAHWFREDRPGVVQTWMHDADLIGGLVARVSLGAPVVWGIHHGRFEPEAQGQPRILRTARVCAKISKAIPRRIVCCSETSRIVHGELGYDRSKMVVIPNGFDVDLFRPDPDARREVRRELSVPEHAPLIGLVGRAHPQKDHPTFIAAASLLHDRLPDAHFIVCGGGLTWENSELTRLIPPGLRRQFHLLGLREDIPRLTSAFDLATSSSMWGEAFPLVVGEAMACGVPCVVTDVGDSARIVAEIGRVIPRRDPSALAAAWQELLQLDAAQLADLGRRARARIVERFSLAGSVRKYESLYASLARARGSV